MIRDLDGNKINLCESPNGHVLVLGKSGMGKTYFACRQIETEISRRQKVLLIDFSYSYTQSELHKAKFRYMEKTKTFSLYTEEMKWIYRGDNMEQAILQVLLRTLAVKSYYQKKLLQEAVHKSISGEGFSLPLLKKVLEDFLNVKENPREVENILHLLTRLEPFAEIDKIRVCVTEEVPTPRPLTILQLSDYPEHQRKFLTEFLAGLFWEELCQKKKRADVIVFDEFQNMSLSAGRALSSMLREGRKHGVKVFLMTQFLGERNKDEFDTLMQVGNMLFFRPVPKDLATVSKLIEVDKKWSKTLKKLDVGEMVLIGSYIINGKKKKLHRPIICRVEEVIL